MSPLYFAIGISTLSALIPIAVGARGRGILWYYSILSLISDLVMITFLELGIRNGIVVNVFLLGEWLFLSCWMIQTIIGVKWRNLSLAFSILVAVSFIIHTEWADLQPNLNGSAAFYTCYIVGSIVGFFRVVQNIEHLQIERSPVFMVCAGLLLFASGSLIMLLAKKYLDAVDVELSRNLWITHNVLNVLKNIGIAFSLTLQTKKWN